MPLTPCKFWRRLRSPSWGLTSHDVKSSLSPFIHFLDTAPWLPSLQEKITYCWRTSPQRLLSTSNPCLLSPSSRPGPQAFHSLKTLPAFSHWKNGGRLQTLSSISTLSHVCTHHCLPAFCLGMKARFFFLRRLSSSVMYSVLILSTFMEHHYTDGIFWIFNCNPRLAPSDVFHARLLNQNQPTNQPTTPFLQSCFPV